MTQTVGQEPDPDAAQTDQVDQIADQWARERPDLDSSGMRVVGRLSRITRALEKAVAPVLREHGLQPHEFDVLATLRRSGRPYQLHPQDLLDQMMVPSSTMTHRLVALEERGLLSRGPCPDDGRRVIVTLTEQGRALTDAAVESHYANERRLLSGIDDHDRTQLEALLRRLARSLNT